MASSNNLKTPSPVHKVSKTIDILQINLQHSCKGTASLCSTLSSMRTFICLIQEPYHIKHKIRGLNGCGTLLSFNRDTKPPRACIITSKDINVKPLLEFCNRDVTAILTKWSKGEAVFASVYMDANYSCPPEEMRGLVNFCESNQLSLFVGSDANAHHTVWGSTNINKRGTALLNYLSQVDLHPINKGHRPTFVVANRKEVLDITLVSSQLLNKIVSWKVDDEESSSDHRYIKTVINLGTTAPIKYRNKRKTNWELYTEILKETLLMEVRDTPITTIDDMEESMTSIYKCINIAFNTACPEKILKPGKRVVSWWSPLLTLLRKESRRLYRQTQFGGVNEWAAYAEARNKYNSELRKSKTSAWRTYCESIEDVPVAARLSKVLRQDGTTKLGSLEVGNGEYTKTLQESYELLLKESFPAAVRTSPWIPNHELEDGNTINEIVTSQLLQNAIMTFGPFKAAGKDEIFPALLQKGLKDLTPFLLNIMRGCLALGYVPLRWRESRVVFIPKPGKGSYERASSWRPISLTSFLLKTLERLIDWYIRKPPLIGRLKKSNQFAYMRNVSTEAALHQIVSRIEKALDVKEYCMALFLDVKGAFNEIGVDNIIRALRRFEVHPTCTRFIECMLRTRTTYVCKDDLIISWKVDGGCPQGGVLSPLLWNLVVSEVLEGLIENFSALYSQGFADDISTVAHGIDLDVVREQTQLALNYVGQWCRDVGLSVNDKLSLILFTRKHNVTPIPIKLEGQPIPYQKQVKYLGVILDHKLNWGTLTRARATKCMCAMAQCRRAVGMTWGLTPKIFLWIYLAIIRPALEYGALIWVPATEVKLHLRPLEKVQRLALLGVTGAMSSTPTAALECLLDVRPVGIRVKQIALATSHRLLSLGQWTHWNGGGNTLTKKHSQMVERMGRCVSEYHMPCESIFEPPVERKFSVITPTVKEWIDGEVVLNTSNVSCYTDGSRMGGSSGASYYILNNTTGATEGRPIPLGWAPTVYQAELMGIIRASETLLDNITQHDSIDFYVDSLSALQSVSSPWPVTGLVCEAIAKLNQLGTGSNLRLVWIPAHKGFDGNERADELAKEGTLSAFHGPQPVIPISKNSVRAAISKYARLLHEKEWTKTTSCIISKQFLALPSRANLKIILAMNRKTLRLLTQIITGHCTLNGHLKTMGLVEEATCICEGGPETVFHFLGVCDRYCALRLDIFGRHTMPPEELITKSLIDLASFIVRSGRFNPKEEV